LYSFLVREQAIFCGRKKVLCVAWCLFDMRDYLGIGGIALAISVVISANLYTGNLVRFFTLRQ
jgi:hypothetical protein